jgi:hypothetical protein
VEGSEMSEETELDDVVRQECLLFRREGSSVALRAFRGGYGHGCTEERARIVAMLRVRAGELLYYRTPEGEAVPWASARIEELVTMAKRIEGGGDG